VTGWRCLVTGLAALAGFSSGCTPVDVHIGGFGETSSTAGTPSIPNLPVPAPGECGLASPAFCETFETPQPGGRGGDLDESSWGFTRFGHVFQDFWVRIPAQTYPEDASHRFPASFCGQPFSGVSPGEDVRFCPGTGVDGSASSQLNEVFDDQGDFGMSSLQIRQPFDFTDRTGTIVWDVDAKVNPIGLGHGWWIELWITEEPSPMPYYEEWKVLAFPKNGVGFAFVTGADCPSTEADWLNALDSVHVVSDYAPRSSAFFDAAFEHGSQRCFAVADGHLNHFELRISTDRAELWASDRDDLASFQLRDAIPNLGLSFSRGYVHLQHGQNDARKGGATPSQTFRWDNIGFDGPRHAAPRAYDIPDNDVPLAGGIDLGWSLNDHETRTYDFSGVELGDARAATLQLNLLSRRGQQLDYRFNAQTWRSFLVETATPEDALGRGLSIAVPLADLQSGTNTLELRMPDPAPDISESVANISLTVELESIPQ
jgi:hypothetical protein